VGCPSKRWRSHTALLRLPVARVHMSGILTLMLLRFTVLLLLLAC
jgi:hypothetical protein